MPKEPIQLMRSPKETECANRDCGAVIPFGAYAYVNSDTKAALCLECGVKRGLSSKDRAKQIVAFLELREEIKALKEEKKVLADGVVVLKGQVDLFRLGERNLELEKEVLSLKNIGEKFLRESIGMPEEKEAVRKLLEAVDEDLELRKQIQDQVEAKLYWFRTAEKKAKKKPVVQEATA